MSEGNMTKVYILKLAFALMEKTESDLLVFAAAVPTVIHLETTRALKGFHFRYI